MMICGSDLRQETRSERERRCGLASSYTRSLASLHSHTVDVHTEHTHTHTLHNNVFTYSPQGPSRFQMLKATHSAPHSLVALQDSVEPLFGVVVAAAPRITCAGWPGSVGLGAGCCISSSPPKLLTSSGRSGRLNSLVPIPVKLSVCLQLQQRRRPPWL